MWTARSDGDIIKTQIRESASLIQGVTLEDYNFEQIVDVVYLGAAITKHNGIADQIITWRWL